jgi:hypothetical protein
MSRTRRALAIATVALTAGNTLGCWAIHNVDHDVDRSPVVNTGAGATVIYPGQTAPQHPGNYHPREAGYGQSSTSPATTSSRYSGSYPAPPGAVASQVAVPPPEYSAGGGGQTGAAAPRGANIAMLGGTEIEETQHVKVNEEPSFLKYVMLPFALVAAPFEYGAKAIAGDPKPGPAVPRNDTQPRPTVQPANVPTDYETARLQDVERELDQRSAPGAAPATAPAPTAGGSSFSDELAALRRRTTPAPAPVAVAAAPPVSVAPPVVPARPTAATGQVDRNGDGRTDHWITRENGAIAREELDENFDGRPDRTLIYDSATHEVVQIEEDTNFDGKIDAWTSLRGGQVVGRRVDDNGDGQVDAWSTYRGGVITRLERDTNNDGFRDRVALYQDGRLVREERDDDGDGRTDLITYFDANERVERTEEDASDDGVMDVVSYYQDGHLVRREVLDASVLGAAPHNEPERE